MKNLLMVFAVMILAGCAASQRAELEKFESAPGVIDQHIESATIEDFIVALPPFAFHEETVEGFEARVRRARAIEQKNLGQSCDFLFVGGDGCWPSKDFQLDRERHMLTIRSYNWEPGLKDSIVTMRRVPGGWMRGRERDVELISKQSS